MTTRSAARALLVAILALVLCACGSGGADGRRMSGSSATATPTPTAAAPTATASASSTPPSGHSPVAWAAGGNDVLRSDDGGFSWSVTLGGDVGGLAFVDRREGWVAAVEGQILHTTDAGKTWRDEATTIGGAPLVFNDVAVVDREHVIAVGSADQFRVSGDLHAGPPQIAFTRDGGTTWTRATLADVDLEAARDVRLLKVCATSSGVGLTTGTDLANFSGRIALLTRDGGATWTDISARLPPVLFAQVACAAGTHLWYAARSQLVHSSDAGETWEDLSPNLPPDFAIGGIIFLDPQNGWLVTDATPGESSHTIVVLKTTDGGAHWNQQVLASGLGELTLAIDFLDLFRGVVVAQDLRPFALGRTSFGLTFATGDGGTTWTETILPPGIDAVWDVQLVP